MTLKEKVKNLTKDRHRQNIDLNNSMKLAIGKAVEHRGIEEKRLIESFICLCLLKEPYIPEEQKEELRKTHAKLMQKGKWLTK